MYQSSDTHTGSKVNAVATMGSIAQPRILIADDQPDVLEALEMLLRNNGYQVESASSPSAILEALRQHQFDVVLMDLNYARDTTSGREGLDLLAHREVIGDTPIVVMTGWGSVDVAVEAMQHGVGDFVQKPWDNARLLGTLAEANRIGSRVAAKTPAAHGKRVARPEGDAGTAETRRGD